jgi:hypothetical protein
MRLEYELFDEWSIGIYKMVFDGKTINFSTYKEVKNPILTAKNIKEKKVQFVADPFLVYEKDNYYLFFEALVNCKGCIGLATSKEGKKWKYQEIVLDEPFHLAYPSIFSWSGKYYMLPDAHETKSIRLYEAVSFPYEWKFKKILLNGRNFADPTIFRYKDKWWLFVSTSTSLDLYLYYSDGLEDGWKEHPRNPIVENNLTLARPGGNVIQTEDKLIRITQNGFPRYGKSIRAFEIVELDIQEYKERELKESPILKASGKGWNKDGMHHLSGTQIGNKEWVVSVDGRIAKKKYEFCIDMPEAINRFFEKIFK